MVQTIAIIMILVYVIYQQVKFGEVKWLKYFFLPFFSFFQFFNQLEFMKGGAIEFAVVLIVSLLIGLYQAYFTSLRSGKKIIAYFNRKGKRSPIYRGVLQAKGGIHYVIGWVLAFILQLGVVLYSSGVQFGSTSSVLAGFQVALLDLLIALRFVGANSQSWIVWAIISFMSLSYSLFLSGFSPLFRKHVFQKQEYLDLVDARKE